MKKQKLALAYSAQYKQQVVLVYDAYIISLVLHGRNSGSCKIKNHKNKYTYEILSDMIL